MEHSTHSHPLPHEQDEEQRLSARTSHAPPSYGPSSPPYQTLTPQSRRLQLRNARFNGPSLPTRRVSPLFGLASGPIELFSRAKDNEYSPSSAEKQSIFDENLPLNPVNILQEIQNSARRKRMSPRLGFGMSFQEQQAMDENSKPVDDEEMSWYNEKSTECSPSTVRASPFATGLRERSLNQNSQPPLNSPLTKQTRGKARAPSRFRPDDIDQSRYIEDLESQLASAQAKIDALTSPKTNKIRSVKLRSLTVENRNLLRENFEWAKRADEMVAQEKLRYTEVEAEMRSRLQALEEDMETKDARIAEFEWELESLRTQVRDAEGLQEANASLEKRIDMLSNMLVNSPNKLESHSAAASPNKFSMPFSPSKRIPRPMSMLPRASSSPSSTRLSLASVSETAFWDSRSRSASIVETTEDSSPWEKHNEQAKSPTPDESMRSPGSSKQFCYSRSYDDRSNSTSFDTQIGSSSSRPTSFMSTSSMGVPSWGVPMLPDGESRFSNRQRKMRKFPSGSNTLKPLILPVATTANMQSLPASAPIYPSIEAVAKQDISDGSSIDPTTSFLTRLDDCSSYSTPSVPSRQRSTTFIRERTLNALEGKRRSNSAEEKEFDEDTCVASGSSPETESGFSGPHGRRRSRPRSLQKELEQADIEQAHLNALGISAPDAIEDGLRPSASRSSCFQTPMHLQQRNTTPRARPKSIQSNHSNTPPALKAPNTILFNPTPDHPQSLFARLTKLVTQTKQDPFILARRILANGWALGSASIGGMGWWLIGPLHYHQRCCTLEGNSNADLHNVTDNSSRTSARGSSNWHHFSAEIRNGHVVESGPVRDYGGTWTMPPHPNSREAYDANTVPPFLPSSSRREPHLFPCDECVEPSSRRSLRMWFQFSLTIVLAVGLAVKYGPGVLLTDLSDGEGQQHTAICPRVASQRVQQREQQRQRHERLASQNDEDDTIRFEAGVGAKGEVPPSLADSKDGADSGYGSIAIAEVLRPTDFEAG